MRLQGTMAALDYGAILLSISAGSILTNYLTESGGILAFLNTISPLNGLRKSCRPISRSIHYSRDTLLVHLNALASSTPNWSQERAGRVNERPNKVLLEDSVALSNPISSRTLFG